MGTSGSADTSPPAEYATIPLHEWLLGRMRNYDRHLYARDAIMFGEMMMKGTIPSKHDELTEVYTNLCRHSAVDPAPVVARLRWEKAKFEEEARRKQAEKPRMPPLM